MENTEYSSDSKENHGSLLSAGDIKVEEDYEECFTNAEKSNEQSNVINDNSGITIKEENSMGCDIEDIDNVQKVRTTQLNMDQIIADILRPRNGNVKCVLIPVLTRIDGLYNSQSTIRTAPTKADDYVSKKTYPCNLCGKNLFQRRSFLHHIAAGVCVPRPTVSHRFLCDFCGKSFRKKNELDVHLNRHAGVYPFPCNHCGKRFVSERYLKYHKKSHSNELNFHCNICDKFFKTKSSFNRHTRAGHFRVYNHHCNVCDKSFAWKKGLTRHLKRHLGLLHKCTTCGKDYISKDKLETHRATHTNEKKPYLCEVCGSGFYSPTQLKIHTTVHTGEKPFKCAECGKTFRMKGNLMIHMVTHTGERLFQCDICDKAFAKKDRMKLHRGIHFDSRPYKCSLCSYCFTQSSSLKRHMQTIHNIVSL